MPPSANFHPEQYGLHPANVEVMEGFIFVNFSEGTPPSFDEWVASIRPACKDARTAELKIAARRSVPTKANWKLVVENYRECYHCGPGHSNSYVTAYWDSDYRMTAGERESIEREIQRHNHGWYKAGVGASVETSRYQAQPSNERLVAPATGTGAAMGTASRHWRPGFVTATLDGKPAAPLLPGIKEYTHGSITRPGGGGASGFSLSNIGLNMPDYIRTARFTPRGVMSTDAEAIWLVHPDAKEGKDYNVDHLIALWYNTIREDRWLAENNHYGLLSSRYAHKGVGQPYMAWEGGPAGFAKFYMAEMVPYGAKATNG
jgi:Rieske 2Fe-2S family protein